MPENELILMVGLPRSGKSTRAKAMSMELGAPIVCPDAVRLALHGKRWKREAESMVWSIIKYMVPALFLAGHQIVILDSTALTSERREEWVSDQWKLTYKYIDTPPETCKKRAIEDGMEDLIEVIDRFYIQFESPEYDDFMERTRHTGGTFM